MARQTVEDKIAAWYTAYNAVKAELTSQGMRGHVWDSAEAAARVAANDRTAAIVAAMIVGSGAPARVIPLEADET